MVPTISQSSLTRASTGLGRLTATRAALVHLALDLRIGADVLEGRRVTVVAVDTRKLATVLSSNAIDEDVTLALAAAVSTGSVELAVVLSVEVDDVDCSAAVVLDDLIGSVVRATANDPRLGASLVILDG